MADLKSTGEVDAAAWRALAVVSVATFRSPLDGSVVNVALPSIRAEFAALVASMEWVVMTSLAALLEATHPNIRVRLGPQHRSEESN